MARTRMRNRKALRFVDLNQQQPVQYHKSNAQLCPMQRTIGRFIQNSNPRAMDSVVAYEKEVPDLGTSENKRGGTVPNWVTVPSFLSVQRSGEPLFYQAFLLVWTSI